MKIRLMEKSRFVCPAPAEAVAAHISVTVELFGPTIAASRKSATLRQVRLDVEPKQTKATNLAVLMPWPFQIVGLATQAKERTGFRPPASPLTERLVK